MRTDRVLRLARRCSQTILFSSQSRAYSHACASALELTRTHDSDISDIMTRTASNNDRTARTALDSLGQYSFGLIK